MSTKTSIKRIALVAVAALGFGMVSTVSPVNAAATTFTIRSNSASSVDAAAALTSTVTYASADLSLTVAAATPFVTTDVGRGVWSLKYGFIGTIASVSSTSKVILAAAPTASSSGTGTAIADTNTFAKWWLGSKAATTVGDGITATSISGMTATAGKISALNLQLDGASAAGGEQARITVGGTVLGESAAVAANDQNIILPFTQPIAAGTYSAVVTYKAASGTYIDAAAVSKTFTLTVSAAADFAAALSTAYMGAPAATGMTATTNAIARSASKTNGTAIASIEITLNKSDGTPDTQAHTITATVTGAGYVKADATSATGAAATTRVSTDSTGAATRYVHIGADGTVGSGTVTVTLTNVNTLAVTTLGTWNFSTYGAAAKLEVSTKNYTIGRFGGYVTGSSASVRKKYGETYGPLDHSSDASNAQDASDLTGTTTPAFIVKATDSSGNAVNLTSAVGAAIVPTVVSSDISVVTTGACSLDSGAAVYGSSTNGVGYYNCSFTSAPGSVSGGKATLTIRTPNPADTSTYLTTTIDVTLGGKASTGKETLTLDKTSYSPGEGMTVTFSAVDAAGNPVADGIASPAVSFNKQTGGAAGLTGWYVNGKDMSDSSTGGKTVFAPAVEGDFFATATAASLATLTAAATVAADAGTGAAIDAANEATDAANAATDAANAAAEAADAATAAAQDAQAAVAALATQVSTLIAGIKAQITTLTNLVIKIQKKVRA